MQALNILFFFVLGGYFVGATLHLLGIVFGRPGRRRLGSLGPVAGVALHTVALAVLLGPRGGHPAFGRILLQPARLEPARHFPVSLVAAAPGTAGTAGRAPGAFPVPVLPGRDRDPDAPAQSPGRSLFRAAHRGAFPGHQPARHGLRRRGGLFVPRTQDQDQGEAGRICQGLAIAVGLRHGQPLGGGSRISALHRGAAVGLHLAKLTWNPAFFPTIPKRSLPLAYGFFRVPVSSALFLGWRGRKTARWPSGSSA